MRPPHLTALPRGQKVLAIPLIQQMPQTQMYRLYRIEREMVHPRVWRDWRKRIYGRLGSLACQPSLTSICGGQYDPWHLSSSFPWRIWIYTTPKCWGSSEQEMAGCGLLRELKIPWSTSSESSTKMFLSSRRGRRWLKYATSRWGLISTR